MVFCSCTRCKAEFTKLRRRGSMDTCPACLARDRISRFRAANPDRVRSYASYGGTTEAKKKYASTERGKEVGRAKAHRWYWKDPEHARAAGRAVKRALYAADRDAHIQRVVNRLAHIRRATPPWADLGAIAVVYAEARRLTRETGIEHRVDHIVPLRGKVVSGLHVATNLRIVHASVNASKGNAFVPVLLTAEP
jgi:hypothetical protein